MGEPAKPNPILNIRRKDTINPDVEPGLPKIEAPSGGSSVKKNTSEYEQGVNRPMVESKKTSPIKKDQLEAIVRGALKDTIYSHGPITAKYISSASKRITGSIVGLLEKYYALEASEGVDKP